MKLLLFSDLHLDTPFVWAPAEVARRRRQALRETLLRIARLAQEREVDAVLCGGDLYEQDRFARDTGEFLRSVFADLHPTPVYISPGNHDWFGRPSLYQRVEWSPNVHVFAEERLAPVVLADGLTLWGAAHHAPAGTGGFLSNFEVDRSGTHLTLFHGSERSWLAHQGTGKMPHAPFDAAEIERAGVHHALLGHYHYPRDATLHTYPGNPDPLTFGEEGERGVVIVAVAANGDIQRERVSVAVSEVHDVRVDIGPCRGPQEVRESVASALQGLGGVARVTLEGDVPAELNVPLADLTDAAPWMEAIVVRSGRVRVQYDLDAIAREQTVRGQFVRDVNASGLSDDQRSHVLITGLRALDGRDDLEVSEILDCARPSGTEA